MKNLTLVKNNILESYTTLAEENTFTWEDLKKSKHLDSHCLKVYDLAESVVCTNREKLNNAGLYNGFDLEDWKSALGLSSLVRHNKLIAKYSTPYVDKDTGKEKEHNPVAYTFSTLNSTISKELKPYYVQEHREYEDEDGKSHKRLTPVEEIDANGNTYKKKHEFVSGDIKVDPGDPYSPSSFDLMESSSRTEDDMERSEAERISNEHLLKYFEHFANQKSKGPLFAYIEDTLYHNDFRCGLDYLKELFRNADLKSSDSMKATIHAIVNVYNNDLIVFMHFIGVYDVEFIKRHLVRNSWEFVKNYAPKNEKEFNKHISRFRYRYKLELANQLGIELGDQEREKKSA